MKFGQVKDPTHIDFSLPSTPSTTLEVLKRNINKTDMQISIGCAKWNKTDLKGFYPKGTKDELAYYATQFNSIELNATFYKSPNKEQVQKWKDKTPEDFKFFPKVPQSISHYGRLQNIQEKLSEFCDSIAFFEEKLGMTFLQLHDNFSPKDFDKLRFFLEHFPKGIPLAIELRNEQWFSDKAIWNQYLELLTKLKITNIIVDTAGRRDMLHMQLTTPTAFIRYVGSNQDSDYERLDTWVDRIKEWETAGLKHLYFFVHQNIELASPLLAGYFIEKLNKALNLSLKAPNKVAANLFD